ncbi:DUF882 domain-containing protein [Sinorhizobium meliloti]|jgi:uncharacterized protein YcbK (DUF882 family)|uniref:DUF882 domain-containing protein n=1 Tax=Rhizobium meliloti TaxID=382 RepID=UPI0012953846|nr:DUF882 domain-containing protein [Sinorhizobium meliloti]MDW9593737.1 DUF882 domain-containing protein [Sinorhizobium meliloti]MDX0188809.1 DUF882 domain-containing protein [Sinorhizobium meliloti]MQV12016.1 DUF882 domain-containing protein [Sinorhizobium meliloti]MQV58773.1 DUF882 domain-containing protein [Sinorhizobium meliloti]
MPNLFGLEEPVGSFARRLCSAVARKAPQVLASIALVCSLVTPGMAPPVEAAGQTRTLKLYFIHTKEKAQITYKRNGRYDQKGLQQINRFLRDWRRNEPTKMDPRLLDLVWEVYQKSGSRDYIHVVSAYRSPATNGMLRSRSKGVAKKSQHMLGKAMDFYIPDVKLKTLREVGMKFQVGGVGYYPTSGSPFVHMDVGGVRAWPRMTRNELARLFPDGKTMHIPSDGRPLPGYEQAVADYKRRVGASAIEVAGGGAKGPGDTGKRRNLFAALFGGGGDEDEEPAAIAAGGAEEEAPAKVQTASAPAARDALPGVAGSTAAPAEQDINAPVPAVRPAFKETPADGGVAVALVAPEKNSAQEALAAAMQPTTAVPSEFADLSALKVPVPQMLDRRDMNALIANETLVASADGQAQEFGFVPVPGMRPAGEEALAAVAHAEVTIPASADRLASAAQPPAAGTRVALAAPTSEDRTPAFSPAIEVAAYAPQPGSASREAIFDSVFDTEADAPSKGARPKRQDAEAKSRSSVRTEPKLTKKIISEWALSAGRVATLSKPVKAPRFVSKSLRVAPTTVYAAGFTSNSGAVDTARFSGSAVNFMEVKKFSTN